MFLVSDKAVLTFSGRLDGSLVGVGVAGFWANWQLKSIKERLQDLLLATSLSLREASRQSGRQDFKTGLYVNSHPFCLRFHRNDYRGVKPMII